MLEKLGYKLAKLIEANLGFIPSYGMSDDGYHIYLPGLEVDILIKDKNLLTLDSLMDDSEPLEVDFDSIEGVLPVIVDWVENLENE